MTFVSRSAPTATILIRLMVGGVFPRQGIQKFLYPAQVGIGRFAEIGTRSQSCWPHPS
jgi:putative oxidoreductase